MRFLESYRFVAGKQMDLAGVIYGVLAVLLATGFSQILG